MKQVMFIIIISFISCKKDKSPLSTNNNIISTYYLQSINIDSRKDTISISHQYTLSIQGVYSNGQQKDLSDSVTVSVSNDVLSVKGKNIIAVKKGTCIVKAVYNSKEETDTVVVSEIEYEPIDERFKSTGNAPLKVPIVIINYFPTKDGVTHDDSVGPSSYWEILNPPLSKTKTKVKDDHVITKRIVEYGTRFRDFGTNTVAPYVSIEVVRYINVYQMDLKPWINGIKTIDFHKLFEKINLRDLVNKEGVKEVWMTVFPKDSFPSIVQSPYNDPSTYYNLSEANMASPITGDISNSYRDQNDLPIYNSTYVVYGNSGHRGVAENIHNRGHQIEAQLRHIDKSKWITPSRKELFDDAFVGCGNSSKDNYKWLPLGRAGMTHFPPNTSTDYDYNNSTLIMSDIASWKPSGGILKAINLNTWLDVAYPFDMKTRDVKGISDYNSDPQTKWLLYWFQAIPGANNNIDYIVGGANKKISNWWYLFYNWDEAIKSGKTLWE